MYIKIVESTLAAITPNLQQLLQNHFLRNAPVDFQVQIGHYEMIMSKNVVYTAPTIQNEIIQLCSDVIKEIIFEDCKWAKAYAVLADETVDITG